MTSGSLRSVSSLRRSVRTRGWCRYWVAPSAWCGPATVSKSCSAAARCSITPASCRPVRARAGGAEASRTMLMHMSTSRQSCGRCSITSRRRQSRSNRPGRAGQRGPLPTPPSGTVSRASFTASGNPPVADSRRSASATGSSTERAANSSFSSGVRRESSAVRISVSAPRSRASRSASSGMVRDETTTRSWGGASRTRRRTSAQARSSVTSWKSPRTRTTGRASPVSRLIRSVTAQSAESAGPGGGPACRAR